MEDDITLIKLLPKIINNKIFSKKIFSGILYPWTKIKKGLLLFMNTIHYTPSYTSFKAQNENSTPHQTTQNKLKDKIIQNKNTTIAIGTGLTALAALGTYLITRGKNSKNIQNSMPNITEKLINADTTLLPNAIK